MDYPEATKALFQRIEELDAEYVAKVIGYILLNNQDVHELVQLIYAPNHVLQTLIDEVKDIFGPSSEPVPRFNNASSPGKGKKPLVVSGLPTKSTTFVPSLYSTHSMSTIGVSVPINSSIQNFHHYLPAYFNSPPLEYNVQNQKHICDDFRQGYCKYGGNCRFLHLSRMKNGNFMILNTSNMDNMVIPESIIHHRSLKQLEIELVELLKYRRGIPVSVSSIPILYFDMYGTKLEVDGLLGNQNYGNFIFTMTKLLTQMTNAILLVDRPHGRHSIILAEDIEKLQKHNEVESKVYLTFHPRSAFSEEDVHTYFDNFGPVQEVKIPSQAKRMFGFMTFVYPETSALAMSKINPHVICGAQILVKPFRLKPMFIDRKTELKASLQINFESQSSNAEAKLLPIPSVHENVELLEKQKQIIQECERSEFVSQESDRLNPSNGQFWSYFEENQNNYFAGGSHS